MNVLANQSVGKKIKIEIPIKELKLKAGHLAIIFVFVIAVIALLTLLRDVLQSKFVENPDYVFFIIIAVIALIGIITIIIAKEISKKET